MDRNTYKIDASGKILGRLASEVAILLRGKNSPEFMPNKLSNNRVIVFSISKIVLTGKKYKDKKYIRHSGYLGGIKSLKFEDLFAKDPNKVFKMAVYRMLPKNKLRAKTIKNLKLYAQDYQEERNT